MPKRPEWQTKRKCPYCGDEFMPAREHQIYDVPACRFAAFKERREREIREETLRAAGVIARQMKP